MELVYEYLDKVQKIDGIYVLQVPEETTYEDMSLFHDAWEKIHPDDHLLIMSDSMRIHKRNRYSFYMAMMLVGVGKRVTREEWLRESELWKAPYLCLESTEEGMEPVLVRKWPDNEDEGEYFFVYKEDMDAEDYMLA